MRITKLTLALLTSPTTLLFNGQNAPAHVWFEGVFMN